MNSPFATALLAGGRSTRMKQDKALIHWHGQDLWQAQLHKLQAAKFAMIYQDDDFGADVKCGYDAALKSAGLAARSVALEDGMVIARFADLVR